MQFPESVQTNDDGYVTSYSDLHGEWEDRKISFMGAVRSFIDQLRIGQDLTRVSLPAVFLRPYSLLEEITSRNLRNIDLLFDLPTLSSPLERMLGMVAWMLSMAKEEKFNHKPFYPILGELNQAFVRHQEGSNSNVDGTTYFLGEQISHHPPVAVIRLDNRRHHISLSGHVTFAVKFHGNSATVNSEGKISIGLGTEQYVLKKPLPNLIIRNLILGSKSITWGGEVGVECAASGYSAIMELSDKRGRNEVTGRIMGPNRECAATIKGYTGHKLYYRRAGAKEDTLLLDWSTLPGNLPRYLPLEHQDDRSCQKIWGATARAIIAGDMLAADELKCKVEDHQRRLLAAHSEDPCKRYEPVYFRLDPETQLWDIKDPNWYLNFEEQISEVTTCASEPTITTYSSCSASSSSLPSPSSSASSSLSADVDVDLPPTTDSATSADPPASSSLLAQP